MLASSRTFLLMISLAEVHTKIPSETSASHMKVSAMILPMIRPAILSKNRPGSGFKDSI